MSSRWWWWWWLLMRIFRFDVGNLHWRFLPWGKTTSSSSSELTWGNNVHSSCTIMVLISKSTMILTTKFNMTMMFWKPQDPTWRQPRHQNLTSDPSPLSLKPSFLASSKLFFSKLALPLHQNLNCPLPSSWKGGCNCQSWSYSSVSDDKIKICWIQLASSLFSIWR